MTMPLGEYSVTDVETVLSSHGTECWRVTTLRPDGKIHCHVFPKDTLQNRAAEYGIDPADRETLMDIVLHEPYMVSPLDQLYDETEDPVAKAGLVGPARTVVQNIRTGRVIKPGEDMPVHCFNTDEATARRAHLMRLESCKRERIRISDPGNKLAAIRDQSPIDSAKVANYRNKVNGIREKRPVEVSPIPPTVERPKRVPIKESPNGSERGRTR